MVFNGHKMTIEIKTDRLLLRLLTLEDFENSAKLQGDPEVRRFFPGGVFTKEQSFIRIKELITKFETKGIPTLVIHIPETGEFVGRCGFGLVETGEVEIGYMLHKEYWGKGYATEVVTALLKWAKENISADYIIGFTTFDNLASQRVLQKCGMEFYKDDIGHGALCHFYRIKNNI